MSSLPLKPKREPQSEGSGTLTQKGYKDYEERIKWWTARSDFAREFDKLSAKRDDYIVLTNWDAVRRIEKHVGNQVTVLATVDRIKFLSKGIDTRRSRTVVSSRAFLSSFSTALSSMNREIIDHVREFVAIRGKVSLYKGRPQLEVQRADQVQLSILPKTSKETP